MIFKETLLKGSYVIDLEPFIDDRGWFARTFSADEFNKIGFNKQWVQLNHSFTKHKGTIRGMHYQKPPFGEIKLIRCIAGAVFDVIVDIREGSSTLLHFFGAELSSANRKMMYVPEGFAHGFQALTDNCELIYHHSKLYTPVAEAGIKYNDGLINILWPLAVTNISGRDDTHTGLDENFKGI